MSDITPSASPLYKPAVYAELCSRADITLFVALQHDVKLESKKMTLSANLAQFFGFKLDRNQVFIGVPDSLWPLFSKINFQSFIYHRNFLHLYYQVDLEKSSQYRTATGFAEQLTLSTEELCMRIPMRSFNGNQINSSVVMHLVHMDDELVRIEGNGEQISISKKVTQGVIDE